MEMRKDQFVQIEALPSEQAGKILGARKLVLARNIVRGFAIGFFVCLMVAPFAIYFGPMIEMKQSTKTVLLVISCVIISLFLILPLILGQRNRWLRRIAQQEINSRADKIVNPSASDVHFVEIVPRGNWNDESLAENAVDVGFLAIDHDDGYLLFEGDNERYRIPAQAIMECKQDYYSRWRFRPGGWVGGSKYEVRYFFVVVTVKLSEQPFEIPFRIRFGKNLFTQSQRRFANLELLEEIHKTQTAFAKTS